MDFHCLCYMSVFLYEKAILLQMAMKKKAFLENIGLHGCNESFIWMQFNVSNNKHIVSDKKHVDFLCQSVMPNSRPAI